MTILRITGVLEKTGYQAQASIYNRIRAGTFTRPIQIGQRAVGWPSDEVDALTAALIAGASTAELVELVDKLHALRKTNFTELAQRVGMTPKAQAGTQTPPKRRAGNGRFAIVGAA